MDGGTWLWTQHLVEAGRSGVPGYPQIQSEFEAILGYMRLCLKATTATQTRSLQNQNERIGKTLEGVARSPACHWLDALDTSLKDAKQGSLLGHLPSGQHYLHFLWKILVPLRFVPSTKCVSLHVVLCSNHRRALLTTIANVLKRQDSHELNRRVGFMSIFPTTPKSKDSHCHHSPGVDDRSKVPSVDTADKQLGLCTLEPKPLRAGVDCIPNMRKFGSRNISYRTTDTE